MNNISFPSWLETESSRLTALLIRNQLPHALLIYGSVGVGRRLLAFRLADHLLDCGIGNPEPAQMDGGRIDDELTQSHPDFRVLQPEEDKNTPGKYKKNISVDQIRELIEFLSLTSHQSGAKVVMISPAQLMNISAANCLLKTLEEPAANNFIILVAESLHGLPPTIVSRCHRIRIPLPDRQVSCAWLSSINPDVDWPVMLDLSADAPLAALEWQRIDVPQLVVELERDLTALRSCAETPAMVAKRWVKYDQEPCLRWLFIRLGTEIRSYFDRGENGSKVKSQNRRLQKFSEMLNMEPSFAVLRQIGELRRLQGAGLNTELLLTDVLTRWYGHG